MIIDNVTITVKAGNGGNGAVSFRREKYVPKGGPDGGNGGRGGDIYFIGVSDLSALNQFRNKKEIKADNGINGGRKKKFGKDAESLSVYVPIGTTIEVLDSNKTIEIKNVGEKVIIAKGGRGGLGTFELRSSTNTTPRVAEDGQPGEEKRLLLNLKYIADIGLIGLPNSGKSSLLNALTQANVKTANYAFTTLEPNLGSMNDIIIADIPGLIEGASQGKGLGIKFLKHIEKTHLLVHCVDPSEFDPLESYKTIRNELGAYNPELLNLPEIIILTKKDIYTADKKVLTKLKKLNKDILTVSIIDDESIKELRSKLTKVGTPSEARGPSK